MADKRLLSPRNLVIAAVAAIVLLGAFTFTFFFNDDPDEVSITDAVGAVDGTEPEAADATSDPEPVEPVDPEGTWNVDTEAQPYSFDDNTGSFVGFRIGEELTTAGRTEAVGRTPTVTGQLTLEGTVLTEATFSGDLGDLTTDQSRRDSRTRRALRTSEFPLTTFTLTDPVDLGEVPTPGTPISVEAVGELTVAGSTQVVTVPIEAALSESGLLVVTASFEVDLGDYAIEKPSSNVVVSIDDVATVEVQLYLTKA